MEMVEEARAPQFNHISLEVSNEAIWFYIDLTAFLYWYSRQIFKYELFLYQIFQLKPSPLLTQGFYDTEICDEELLKKNNTDCTKQLCKCLYVLKVKEL